MELPQSTMDLTGRVLLECNQPQCIIRCFFVDCCMEGVVARGKLVPAALLHDPEAAGPRAAAHLRGDRVRHRRPPAHRARPQGAQGVFCAVM